MIDHMSHAMVAQRARAHSTKYDKIQCQVKSVHLILHARSNGSEDDSVRELPLIH